VRSKSRKSEVQLETYGAASSPSDRTKRCYARMIGGLSTRRYQRTVDDMIEGYGVSRSAISRQMVDATAQRLAEFMERDLPVSMFACR
jgi:hypothetical protein